MDFKELVKKISKQNKLGIDKVRFEMAENIGKSIYAIRDWENGKFCPNVIEADKLQRLIKKLYKIDINLYEVFLSTKKHNQ